MYPISYKLKNKLLVSDGSDAWIKTIHDDMNQCVNDLKKKQIRAKFQSEEMTDKRASILHFCAAQMLEHIST